jgi:Ca2+/H+ antiporter
MLTQWLRIIALHAGTPPVVSQTVMSIMLVSLGVLLVGIGFGYLTKSKENLLQHRWALSAAAALTLTAIIFGMLPSFVRYYIDPDVEFYSSLSAITIVHTIIAVPAIITAVSYVFGFLPKKNLRKWMRLSAALFIASFIIGLILFLQMFNLLPSMPGM